MPSCIHLGHAKREVSSFLQPGEAQDAVAVAVVVVAMMNDKQGKQ